MGLQQETKLHSTLSHTEPGYYRQALDSQMGPSLVQKPSRRKFWPISVCSYFCFLKTSTECLYDTKLCFVFLFTFHALSHSFNNYLVFPRFQPLWKDSHSPALTNPGKLTFQGRRWAKKKVNHAHCDDTGDGGSRQFRGCKVLGAGFNRNGAGDSRTQADKVQDTLRF